MISLGKNRETFSYDEEKVDFMEKLVLLMTGDERRELFGRFCIGCGKYDPGHHCQCWNDE